jgi:hypothetical protein
MWKVAWWPTSLVICETPMTISLPLVFLPAGVTPSCSSIGVLSGLMPNKTLSSLISVLTLLSNSSSRGGIESGSGGYTSPSWKVASRGCAHLQGGIGGTSSLPGQCKLHPLCALPARKPPWTPQSWCPGTGQRPGPRHQDQRHPISSPAVQRPMGQPRLLVPTWDP